LFDYGPAPQAVVERVRFIEALCEEFSVPLIAAALQFPCAHPAVGCVLAGARTGDEIAKALHFASLPIPLAFWQALRTRGLVALQAPLPGDPR